jgi:hypothetical protein
VGENVHLLAPPPLVDKAVALRYTLQASFYSSLQEIYE